MPPWLLLSNQGWASLDRTTHSTGMRGPASTSCNVAHHDSSRIRVTILTLFINFNNRNKGHEATYNYYINCGHWWEQDQCILGHKTIYSTKCNRINAKRGLSEKKYVTTILMKISSPIILKLINIHDIRTRFFYKVVKRGWKASTQSYIDNKSPCGKMKPF